MKEPLKNIQQVLERYFEGLASDNECIQAEEYLLSHPGIMEEFTEKMSLALFPDYRNEETCRLPFKTAGEYDESQFLLLAAAAAEGTLSPDLLSDFREIVEADPEKASVAAGFKNLKLKPGKEKWPGKNKMLHADPFAPSIRRIAIYAVSAAAIATALIAIGPGIKNIIYQPVKPVAIVINSVPGVLSAPAGIVVKASPAIKKTVQPVIQYQTTAAEPVKEDILQPQEEQPAREENPVIVAGKEQLPRITDENLALLTEIHPAEIKSYETKKITDNWMVAGLTNIATAIADYRGVKDPVDIAGKGINGINKLLGWDMQLEKEKDKNGEVKAITFESSLLCFSTPVKK